MPIRNCMYKQSSGTAGSRLKDCYQILWFYVALLLAAKWLPATVGCHSIKLAIPQKENTSFQIVLTAIGSCVCNYSSMAVDSACGGQYTLTDQAWAVSLCRSCRVGSALVKPHGWKLLEGDRHKLGVKPPVSAL